MGSQKEVTQDNKAVDETVDESTDAAGVAEEVSNEDGVSVEGAEVPDETEDPANPTDTGDSDLSAEDALKALKKARKEAANYRTRLRESQERLEGAKTPEEFQAAIDELAGQNKKDTVQLIRENVQLRFGLPDDLASTLQGETREELEAQAKVISKYLAPSSTEDPELGGGLDPTTQGGHEDIVATVKRNRNSRY